MLEWDKPISTTVQDGNEDFRAGDLLFFINAGNVRGRGERVLIEYAGNRILGNLYIEDDRERFVPMDRREPPIELHGDDRDLLRVIGIPAVLIRQLI